MAGSSQNDSCGCCAGVDAETPVNYRNLPAQSTIAYRIGRHSQFKESMLAALSKHDHPALIPLGTRDDDDFTIAWLDGVATVLDVLSFYQERYVNEHYLTTSSERRSVLEMAQLIGYELAPGVAAATHLAFTLQVTPGVPVEHLDPITIPAGTRTQSVPGQDETPQTFETTEAIEARAAWNAVPVQTTIPYTPLFGDVDLYLQGSNINIAVGDAILIVGQARLLDPGSERWDVRIVKRVERDNLNARTRLVWDDPLGSFNPHTLPAETQVNVYVFRKRNSLFGHNAIDPGLLDLDTSGSSGGTLGFAIAADTESAINSTLNNAITASSLGGSWPNYAIQNDQIDLANPEDKLVAGSWLALVSNKKGQGSADLPGYVELYRADAVMAMSRSDYAISGKITRVIPDTNENINQFGLRKTLVLAVSEELAVDERPLNYPVFGDELALHSHIDGITAVRYCSISGIVQRLKVAPGVNDLQLEFEGESRDLRESDSLQIVAMPEKMVGSSRVKLSPQAFGLLINKRNNSTLLRLQMRDSDGMEGVVLSRGRDWQWHSNDKDDRVAEISQIDDSAAAVQNDRFRSRIELVSALKYVYQRDTVNINFNVVAANHGETVTEILGDGDARQSDQLFQLKQSPLTYVSADTPSGSQSTVALRVNNLLWQEVDSLYQQGGRDRVYTIQRDNDGMAAILFGDGVEGGRLPSGKTNIRASYRKAIGSDANVLANKITTLLQKPLGVQQVANPEPATGGADAEVIDDAKQNAPLTVLTLDRAVSIDDYRNYARAFAGVAKAHALWINTGASRGIFITVAGVNGAIIPSNSSTYNNLLDSLRRYGDALLPLTLVNYLPVSFRLSLAVKVRGDAVRDEVLAELELRLRTHFSFANRDFGQHVSQDEVLAVAHSLNNVEAVRLIQFYKLDGLSFSTIETILSSGLPVASITAPPHAAELLTLSDEPLLMETFS
jgi:hypothetical protein